MSETAARKVGRYEVERELAEGGMGVVYLARQPSLERPVVLKRMRRELADDEEAEARFLREARSAAAIQHPNVVGVYDCFTWRGEPYIACEYVDGLDGATVLTRTGSFPPRVAALVALEIARGLQELHARSLVHRDLKPDNVLLGRRGEVKIADFGIAHDAKAPSLTRSGISLGTPAYMAPEQLRGERVDERADVFALGAMLYELLAGRTPFTPPDAPADDEEPSLLRRIEQGTCTPLRRAAPGTPRALASIVMHCLRARPKRRVASAAELCTRLESYLGAMPPAEARGEIADWLEASKAFPARGRTKRAEREDVPAAAPRGRRLRRLAFAAILAGLIAVAVFTFPAWPSYAPDWSRARSWLAENVPARLPMEAMQPEKTVKRDADPHP